MDGLQQFLSSLQHSSELRDRCFDVAARTVGMTPTLRGGLPSPLPLSWIEAMVASPAFSKILDLRLNACGITEEGVKTIASSPRAAQLQKLSLFSNRLDSASLVTIATSPMMSQLVELDVGDNEIDDCGTEALASSTLLSRLRMFEATENPITDAGAIAVAQSFALRNLRHLDLRWTEITARGIAELAMSPILSELRELRLGEWEEACGCRESLLWRYRMGVGSVKQIRSHSVIPLDFCALCVARLISLGAANDNDILGLSSILPPKHQRWWEETLATFPFENLRRVKKMYPHPILVRRLEEQEALQERHEDYLFS